MGIVDEIGVNTWLDVTLDTAPDEFLGQLRSPEVTDPRLNSQWQITNRHMFSGVSWGAESESVVHLQTTSSHPLGQSSSFDPFEFWPLRRWRPARVMPIYLGTIQMLNPRPGGGLSHLRHGGGGGGKMTPPLTRKLGKLKGCAIRRSTALSEPVRSHFGHFSLRSILRSAEVIKGQIFEKWWFYQECRPLSREL